MNQPFWKKKTLSEMTEEEWESLCDGCGKCCLVKLEDEDTGEIHNTRVACTLFDASLCQCQDYSQRFKKVDDCINLTPDNILQIPWLPETCGYLLVAKGEDLAWWHPLISGSSESVHGAGMSVQNQVLSEDDVKEEDLPHYIVESIES